MVAPTIGAAHAAIRPAAARDMYGACGFARPDVDRPAAPPGTAGFMRPGKLN